MRWHSDGGGEVGGPDRVGDGSGLSFCEPFWVGQG